MFFYLLIFFYDDITLFLIILDPRKNSNSWSVLMGIQPINNKQLDYSEHINAEALVLFLDFYKAFDTVEHTFMFNSLQAFGFGPNFIWAVQMLYRNINSCVMTYPRTTSPFSVTRSVRQGCPLSPFLFLLVVELLAIQIKNSYEIKGINIFGNEIKIT